MNEYQMQNYYLYKCTTICCMSRTIAMQWSLNLIKYWYLVQWRKEMAYKHKH